MTAIAVVPRVIAAVLVAALLAGCGIGSLAPARDPNVRSNIGGEFLWAVGPPSQQLGAIDPDAARRVVDRAAAVIEPGRDDDFPITIVATFDTADEAEAYARDIEEILEASARWYADPANTAARALRDDPDRMAPLTPPEKAAMTANLLAPGERGVGWGGAPGMAGDSVYTLGPVLIITGLEADRFAANEPPLHPMAHLLAAAGGDVLLEGDRFGEGSIVADLSCSIDDPAAGMALLDEVGDALMSSGQFDIRPPWLEPPLTTEEARARATYRRWTEGMIDAFRDGDMALLAQRIGTASSPEEREAAMRELDSKLLERGLTKMQGEVDTATLALILERPDYEDRPAHDAWTRAMAERMGALPVEPSEFGDQPLPDDYARLPFTGSARLEGGRLDLGWMSFATFAAAWPYATAYLEERGCTDMTIGTVDFDKVRGD